MDQATGERAVVLGGSVGGLLAARVLADAYAEVIVVDRDRLAGVDHARRGVPQGRHAHGVLAAGQEALEELLPGLTGELTGAGVPVCDLGRVRWSFDGRRLHPAETGLLLLGIARPVLERRIRERVTALPNVVLREETDFIEPVTTADRSRVTGARVHGRAPGSAPEVLAADLVVDATGRGSRLPAWLAAAGFPPVPEDRVTVDLTYTSRNYRLRADPFHGDQSINPVATPSHPRGAFLHTLGGDECLLSLTGILGDRPPTDEAGLLAYTRSLPVPDVYDAIKDAEPLNDPVSFRFPASVRHRYERLPAFPAGLLAIGDAICGFNPVYGQGMAVAALEALTLRRHLDGGEPGPRAFFADAARVVDAPWEVAATGDLAFPGVDGKRTLKVRAGNAFLGRLRSSAVRDPRLTTAFLRVAGLVDPPEALMRPSVALRTFFPRTPAEVPRPAREALSGRVSG